MPLDDLFAEASRQLGICNACRYCEGYCAAFPALERRIVLTHGDLTQIAHLCHDCRACFQACMYAPPHEFAVDVPAILAAARLRTSRDYVWPPRVPAAMAGWRGVVAASALSVAAVLVMALAFAGPGGLAAAPGGPRSPYALIPYPALLALLAAVTAAAVAVVTLAAVRYWRDAGGSRAALRPRAVWRATRAAVSLRYLKGGGGGCYYPGDDVPSPARRRLHGLVLAGFGLCVLSTVSAGIEQDAVGLPPPYPFGSVPVLAGTAGGVALAAGCGGLLWLKARGPAVTSVPAMTVKDYGLLAALLFLAVSGLAVLASRATAAFAAAYLVHLAAVLMCFAMVPYSKFTHAVFRFLALLVDEAEAAQAAR